MNASIRRQNLKTTNQNWALHILLHLLPISYDIVISSMHPCNKNITLSLLLFPFYSLSLTIPILTAKSHNFTKCKPNPCHSHIACTIAMIPWDSGWHKVTQPTCDDFYLRLLPFLHPGPGFWMPWGAFKDFMLLWTSFWLAVTPASLPLWLPIHPLNNGFHRFPLLTPDALPPTSLDTLCPLCHQALTLCGVFLQNQDVVTLSWDDLGRSQPLQPLSRPLASHNGDSVSALNNSLQFVLKENKPLGIKHDHKSILYLRVKTSMLTAVKKLLMLMT